MPRPGPDPGCELSLPDGQFAKQPPKRETPRMSGADLQELAEVKGLIARRQHVGVLTYLKLATAAAELGLEERCRSVIESRSLLSTSHQSWGSM